MTPTRQTAAALEVHLHAEIERLRAMLDRQPACLMRIGIGGTLLAVNEAALGLLGARALADVLGASMIERIDGPAGATLWSDFVARVSIGGSASLECEMTDLAGQRRAVVVQGITLPPHPDGDESLLVTVRDVSTARRLEVSLQEQDALRRAAQETLHDATTSLQALRTQLAEVSAERDRLRAAYAASQEERQQLAGAFAELKGALKGAIDAALLAQQVVEKGGRS